MKTIHTVFAIRTGLVDDEIFTTVNPFEAKEKVIALAIDIYPDLFTKDELQKEEDLFSLVDHINTETGMQSLEIIYRTSLLQAEPTAFGFCVQDVIQQAAEDENEITEEDAIEIIALINSKGDASVGVNWDTISYFTDLYLEDKDKHKALP